MEEQKRKENTTAGKKKELEIPSFLILLIATTVIVIITYCIGRFIVAEIISEKYSLYSIPYLLCRVNIAMLFILMLFFYVSLRCLKDLKKAAEAAERGEVMEQKSTEGDIADMINVIGRVSLRMNSNSEKNTSYVEAKNAFVTNRILEYCNVDASGKIEPGVIGNMDGTRYILVLGDYHQGIDTNQISRLIEKITQNGGYMLSSTSEVLCAIFPGTVRKDPAFIKVEMKKGQRISAIFGNFDIVLAGSETCMYVRARECPLKDEEDASYEMI